MNYRYAKYIIIIIIKIIKIRFVINFRIFSAISLNPIYDVIIIL